MTLFDGTVNIQAPPDMVWQEALKAARRGRIISEEPNHLLIAIGGYRLGYVYWLEEQEDGSTRLRHVVDSAANVLEILYGNQDIPIFRNALAARADIPRQSIRETIVDLLVDVGGLSQMQAEQIKKNAEKAARKAQWIPENRRSQVSNTSTTSPSVSVKTFEGPLDDPNATMSKMDQGLKQQDESRAPLPPPSKPPWNPRSFIAMAFVFSFAASGILAGLNWRRLGKPQWMWPTILLSVVGFIGFVAVLALLPDSENPGTFVAYIINLGFGALLAYTQNATYKEWVATYGESTTRQSGCLIPIGIGVGVTAVVVLIMFGPSLLPTDRALEHYNQGVEYQQQGQLELAIGEYAQAIELNPQAPYPYNDRGTVYMDLGDCDRAIADFTRAIELNHDPLSWPYNNRGFAYADKDNYDQAIADYTKAIELKPDFGLAYNNRGVAYALTGQYDEALADLDKTIEIDASNAMAYYLRGAIYADTEELEKAVADLETALELDLEPHTKQEVEGLLEELGQ